MSQLATHRLYQNSDLTSNVMEKVYKPAKFNASEKVNLKEVFCSFERVESVKIEDLDELVFEKLEIFDELERHRLMTECSVDLLDEEDDDVETSQLESTRVRDTFKDIYKNHRYHKETNREVEITPTSVLDANLRPGDDFAVSLRIYYPFRFTYNPTSSKRLKNNSHANLKFSHEIVALGSNTLGDVRDTIRCPSDTMLCVEFTTLNNLIGVDPKTLYPSGFFFIDDTFYNDLRSANSVELSDVVLKWARDKDIVPMRAATMSTTRLNELTPRFGYPYVYVHQGSCEHVLVFSDAWRLSACDELNSKAYPKCTSTHELYTKLCQICGTEPAKWICMDSDRLPQDRMIFCNTCFVSYNYVDGNKMGKFKAYPYLNANTNPKDV